jgi:ribosomal protein L37AE/L43A
VYSIRTRKKNYNITVILRITELEQTMTDRVYWEKKATKLYHACADCGSEVDKRRAKLGYDVCMMCGERTRQGSTDWAGLKKESSKHLGKQLFINPPNQRKQNVELR